MTPKTILTSWLKRSKLLIKELKLTLSAETWATARSSISPSFYPRVR